MLGLWTGISDLRDKHRETWVVCFWNARMRLHWSTMQKPCVQRHVTRMAQRAGALVDYDGGGLKSLHSGRLGASVPLLRAQGKIIWKCITLRVQDPNNRALGPR